MQAVWEKAKRALASELPRKNFTLWIDPIQFLESGEGTLVLGCPNKFARNWIMENYLPLLHKKVHESGGDRIEILLKVQRGQAPSPYSPEPSPQLFLPNLPPNGRSGLLPLNRDYTFDRFVVGHSNEFAYTASKAISQSGQCQYDTLLMLAGTGLGKSHLAQAVGHAMTQENPKCRVFYITAEQFTNEMITALKNNCIDLFKNKYRKSCDVLLLEEVQFLSGKERIQLELGHTLDVLANDHKRILFTSSLPPKDIPSLSGELRSRLTSGLVTVINKPDFETRVRILERKAAEHSLQVSPEVLHFLAGHLRRDIRQMESALTCLRAKSELLKAKIDLDLAREVASCLVTGQTPISALQVRDLVCKYYKVDPEVIRSKSRKRAHACPRNIYVYLCRRHTDETIEQIAASIDRSHSTALYAEEIVQRRMKTDDKFNSQVQFLSRQLEDMKK
jgi:chromosomal replication initiator protein